MRLLYAVLLSGIYALPCPAAVDDYALPTPPPQKVLLAKRTKKKKVKEEDEFGPSEVAAADNNDNGVGIHREQIGVDTPYKAEVGGSGDIAFLSRKAGAAAQGSTNVDINVRILFILGHAALGGELGLLYDATKKDETAVDATGKQTTASVTATTTGVAVIPMFKWNFSDINHSLTVPFAYLGLGYASEQSKNGDADAQKSGGPIIKAGVGLNLFLTGFAAINPAIEYRVKSLKPDKGDTITESGAHLLGGFTLFL